jgi:hypothetical protein
MTGGNGGVASDVAKGYFSNPAALASRPSAYAEERCWVATRMCHDFGGAND